MANIELAQLKYKFSLIAVIETWTTDDDQDGCCILLGVQDSSKVKTPWAWLCGCLF